MTSKGGFDPLTNYTEEQLSEFVKANDALEKEEAKIINDEIVEEAKKNI